ncbi:hypothetical protein Pcinc_039671 [Petrolisthes cinctipes]|uniref:Uncharacterized protein n=1 Tax=Petrolisthes cinctipes TaxID=88211 RepID=A0AAE1BR73_PETCI|nr:hypothetical protein Pcinc_039671 [Petrolisthes cinctipes]
MTPDSLYVPLSVSLTCWRGTRHPPPPPHKDSPHTHPFSSPHTLHTPYPLSPHPIPTIPVPLHSSNLIPYPLYPHLHPNPYFYTPYLSHNTVSTPPPPTPTSTPFMPPQPRFQTPTPTSAPFMPPSPQATPPSPKGVMVEIA